MKLEFALDLSHDGIRLLHLAAEGEPVLSEVALDDPDFDAAVAEMRHLAEGKAEGPLRTELLIPESEVLYTSIEAPGPDRATRDRRVRDELEGMTPYALEDLVFDWRGAGDTALVAAVARDTLAEAEAFATTHGFNPVRFSARPRAGAFRGRPRFGETARAAGAAAMPGPVQQPAPATGPRDAGADALGTAAITDPVVRDTADDRRADSATGTPEVPAPQAARSGTGTAPRKGSTGDEPSRGPAAGAAGTGGETTEAPAGNSDAAVADSRRTADSDAATETARPAADAAQGDTAEEGHRIAPAVDTPDGKARPSARTTREPADAESSGDDASTSVKNSSEGSGAEGESGPEAGDISPKPSPASKAARDHSEAETFGDEADTATTTPEGASSQDTSPRPAPAAKARKRSEAELLDERPSAAATTDPEDPATPAASDSAPDDVPPMPAVHALTRPGTGRIPPAPPLETPDADRDDDTSAAIAFMSRRTGPAPTDPIPPMPNRTRLGSIASRIALLPDQPAPKPLPRGRRAQPPAPQPPGRPAAALRPAAPSAGPRGAAAPATSTTDLPDSRLAEATLAPVSDDGGKALGPGVRASLSDRMAAGHKLDEAEALTVFGARGRATERRGAPRLLLGGLALVALLALGAWGGLSLLPERDAATETVALVAPDDEVGETVDVIPPGPGSPDDADLAPLPQTEPTETADAPAAESPEVGDDPAGPPPVPDTAEETPARSTTESPVAVAEAPDRAAAPAPDDAPGAPEAAPALPAPLTPEAALSRYASTGIWQMAPEPSKPPAADRIEDVYRAALDPEVGLEQAAGLPVPAAAEPEAPSNVVTLPPTAAGTDFAFDSRGLVQATPQGALSPEGIRVHAGRPPVTPPDRPATPEGFVEALTPSEPATPEPPFRPMPRPRSAVDETGAAETAPAAEDTPADTAMAGAEGADTAPATEDATADTATADIAAPADSAATRQANLLRPPARPARLSRAQDQAIDAAIASVAASTAAQTSGAASTAAQTSGAASTDTSDDAEAAEDAVAEAADAVQPERISPYAVAQAPLPAPRPASLAEKVAAARAAQAAQAAPVATAARAAPSGPTPGAVSRQATLGNAIDLGRMSLIGTYGSQANRRALLRLPSGRFVKVKVGDRVEGGQIAGIGDGALRFRKGGRDVTLAVPNG